MEGGGFRFRPVRSSIKLLGAGLVSIGAALGCRMARKMKAIILRSPGRPWIFTSFRSFLASDFPYFGPVPDKKNL